MTKRFIGGELSQATYDDDACKEVRSSLEDTIKSYKSAMDAYDLPGALKAINSHVVRCNQFIEKNPPFELRKDQSQSERVAAILYHLCESCLHLSILLSPFLPDASAKIRGQLRAEQSFSGHLGDLNWGLLQGGHQTGKAKPVFPRIILEEDQN
jgi:methionyl-tRNA synthetase